MAKVCCICGTYKVEQDDNIILFNFPISAYLRRKWKAAIQISERVTYDMMVCSRHFGENDYKTVRGKPRLVGKAVPSLLLNSKTNATEESNIVKNETNKEKDRNSDENSIEIKVEEFSTDKTLTEETIAGKLTDKPLKDKSLTDQGLTDKLLTKADIKKNLEDNVPLDTEINLELLPDNNKNRDEDKSNSDKIVVLVTPDILLDTSDVNSNEVPNDSVIDDSELKQGAKNNSSEESGLSIPDAFHGSRIGGMKSTSVPLVDPKEDIEDIITNYHIQNNGQLVMETDVQVKGDPQANESDPVFIEISVGRDPHSSAPSDAQGNQDCLMVLESVQCDVDPTSFLLPEQEYDIPDDDDDDDVLCVEKKPEPVSLLTSSDESDVILEEPKIDTVDVSDETDEDDIPLVKLMVKPDQEKTDVAKIMFGLYEYYCIKCKFYTRNKSEYTRHVKEHERVLQICQVCGFTTSTKGQFDRHRRKHKDDRRFKCHLCDYRARHNMSLIYHLKTHEMQSAKRGGYSCRCGFHTDDKGEMLSHVKACEGTEESMRSSSRDDVKKLTCLYCSYATNKFPNMKRHVSRKHIN